MNTIERFNVEAFEKAWVRDIPDATFRMFRRLMRHRERYIRAWLAFARVPPQMLTLVTRGPFFDDAGERIEFRIRYDPVFHEEAGPEPELWRQMLVWLETVDSIHLARGVGIDGWQVTFRRREPDGAKAKYFGLSYSVAGSLKELWREVLLERPWTHVDWPVRKSPR